MSSWVALNIEPDEAIEEEIDDTKEIQIEEALKLYQNALKLHSQGPQFYPQAAEAYEALLNSEIFKYPESLSDYKRSALQDVEASFAEAPDDIAPGSAESFVEFNVSDSTSSTLLQTIYLSYKNYGQYTLDSLQAFLQNNPQTPDNVKEILTQVGERTRAALASFAEALERDDTDLNLWRRGARLGSALQSFRLARFCLESVLADDENRLEVRTDQLGLDETFAEGRLRETLQTLNDRLSVSQVPLKKPKKALLKFLERQKDPYPYLPNLPDDLNDENSTRNPLALHGSHQDLAPSSHTWTAVGDSVLQALADTDDAVAGFAPGTSISFSLPDVDPEAQSLTTAEEDNLPSSHSQDVELYSTQVQDFERSANYDGAVAPTTPVKVQVPGPTSEQADDQSSVDQHLEKQLLESLENQSARQHDELTAQEAPNRDEVEPHPASAGRKRSSASAANDDYQAEPTRTKSRRTRLRESNAEASLQSDEVPFDQTKYFEDRLQVYIEADEWMFATARPLLSKIGVEELENIDELRKLNCSSLKIASDDTNDSPMSAEQVLRRDLGDIVKSWDEAKSQAILQDDNTANVRDMKAMDRSGLAIFLDHSRKSIRKPGSKPTFTGDRELFTFLKGINEEKLNLHEVAFAWLKCLLMPGYGQLAPKPSRKGIPAESTYVAFQWPGALKENVVKMSIHDDEYIHKRASEHVQETEDQILRHASGSPFKYSHEHLAYMEMIQTIFEIHLEVYASINNPNSEVDQKTRVLQKDRLMRWSMLARTALTHYLDYSSSSKNKQYMTIIRHLWASTYHSNMEPDVHREHVLLCLHELKEVLIRSNIPVIYLVNNAIMPELSAAAIDQELSKLNSMDFFMKIFSPASEDPVELIETIEPILEPSSVEIMEEENPDHTEVAPSNSQLAEMRSFLDRGDATLRLFLWRRLQDAYQAIDYPPKVVSCHLRCVETIIKELLSPSHLEEPLDHREVTLIRWLKSLGNILIKLVTLVLQQPDKAYECLDMAHLKSSMSSLAVLMNLLHSFVLYEDSVRVGQTPSPSVRGALSKSLENFREKLREMVVRCWILQYTLLKEAIAQNHDLFENPLEDRILLLRSVHNALGARKMCKRSSKQFLKLMKAELFSMESKEDYEYDICQILQDLYGVNLSPSGILLYDHECPPEKLDRATAIMMIEFVMKLAKRMSIKDLSKSELKSTIEKIQQAIGTTKSPPPLTYNKRILSAYLKSPLNPTDIFRAVRGVADLSLIPVSTESAAIAQNGWFFLLGHAALTKFRSQKRLNPVPTTDLDDAVSYFRQDLEHGTGRWESWYRLAQTYDSKLEEDITWSADKINNNRTELVTWQRNAIHCYAMAIATAKRNADPTAETRGILSELYTDFGIRLYSSSREPLSMSAFSLSDYTRPFSNEESQQMYQGQPFREMRLYSVWNLASYLLKRATIDKPKSWMNHYMLSKCLWKMFSCDDAVRGNSKRISLDDFLDSLLDAIDTLPQRKDSRSDPIFEPHYKLVSIIHKLVERGTLTPAEGSKTLLATPLARKVSPPEDKAGWKPYIMEVLRRLKHADKSNWHHRMAVRAAHITYDDSKDAASAAAAKGELTQQIFTKTMTIQVWKPEFERPGRHFVYTTRYVYFFVNLLDQLDDRVNLDQLLRRVRKKQGDFINHPKLWEDVCLTYARVIRRAGSISEGHEEQVFKPIGWEEFVANTARLENLPQLAPDSSILLELLRDAIELKKLNNNLMKVSLLEDLIADLYSRLYEINMPQVLEQANEENKGKMKVDHLLMTSDGAADTPTPPNSAPASEAPAPRGRTKGIARRDIQKRAETIVNRKLAPRALTTKTPALTEAEPAAPSEPAASTTKKPLKREDLGAGPQSDIPHSIQDSADDESELSEIDDEKLSKLALERKLLFPNLRDRLSPDPESEMSVPASVDGDIADEAGDGDADLGDGDGDEGEGEGDGDVEGDGEEGEEGVEAEGDEADPEEDEELDGDEEDNGDECDNLQDMEDAGEDPEATEMHEKEHASEPEPMET
ncbi:putative transcriptional corepressor of histone genes (Hir3) [Aspergillus clavatus NRRL 1]|uniref:Histone transcription regulator 3 homolog n=1 Tax=Aspergillus clavatus (strain ATCC 1007 / CBS 513.65 / DSM 816 / NCTC 3887 / NRRL 1 / QM 1276 / 107) TaxID=344612 RepID=A1CL26_ASPCL|nr:transcriptional corepressor of histone genes (Hir3), putative [Aspergillus clavatus NRRL 1]EAW09850.1 transcriptional corepressor of histone genes (Hir3), putative [Aspergillus clavatus NRRL 1]